MGAVLTHVVVGILVAAVAGVRTRDLPLAGVASMLLDLDHVFRGPGPTLPYEEPVWMMARATLHNLWIVAVLPALVGLYLYWTRRGPRSLRRLVVAGPAVLSSHTLFDMLAVHSGFPENGSVPFYPFSMTRYSFDLRPLLDHPPLADALSFGLGFALLLGLAARLLATDRPDPDPPGAEEDGGEGAPGGDRTRRERLVRATAYGLFFVVVLPLFTWATTTPVPA